MQATDTAALAQQIAILNDQVGHLVEFTAHLTSGIGTAHALEWLKGTSLLGLGQKFSALRSRAKTLLAVVAAACTATGIGVVFQHAGPGDYVLHLTGATGVALATAALKVAENFVFQQAWYQGVLKPKVVSGPDGTKAGAAGVKPVPVVVAPAGDQ